MPSSQPNGAWDAIVFDCDGILIDSEPIYNRVMQEMVTDIGIPMTLEQTKEVFVGRAMPTCLQLIRERLGGPEPEDFSDRFHATAVTAFESELTTVEGIERVLDWLPWPSCVASSSDHDKLELTLSLTGLHERFKGRIYSAQDVTRGKPFPDLFLHAARSMGALPERCAVVEDSLPGVEAGLAAGMTVFAFTGTMGRERMGGSGAAAVFDDMSELPALLERHRLG